MNDLQLPQPTEGDYTSCYCEENIYLLCHAFSSRPEILESWDIYVVFLSNDDKTVALWSQKRSERGYPVIWDYHAVLVLKPKSEDSKATDSFNPMACPKSSVVYDYDSTLCEPMVTARSWKDYFLCTFLDGTPPAFQSKFRVIPGEMFLKHFASDRSHMLDIGVISSDVLPRYLSPPPLYPPIRGQSAIDKGVYHNLMTHYVDMLYVDDSGYYGKVCGRDEIIEFF